MKKATYLLSCLAGFLLLMGAVHGQSPCSVDTSLSSPGIYPDPMPDGCVGVPYSEVVQFVFPVDTTVQGFTLPFDSFQINSVANLPTGLMYACNISSCKFYPAGPNQPARGCALVSGVPTTAAGPMNQMAINFTGWATAPIIGVQMVTSTIDLQLDVYASATASFTSSSSANTVTFNNTSTGATSYFWDFGDGNSSNQASPSHTYNNIGNYNVCLIADNGNCADTTCMVIATGCPAPTAIWSSSANNLTVSFTDMSLSTNSTWVWDLGDGNTTGLQNPTHTYAAPGTYQVCLTVTDSCGSDTSCMPVTVTCPAPASSFSFLVNALTTDFTSTATGTGTLSYLWDFDDAGATSTMANPSHTYPANGGTFNVCLTVTDDCGTDSTCQTVTIIGVGTPEPEALSMLQVFPNPNAGTFTLRGLRALDQSMHIRVTDIVGKTLHQQVVDAGVGEFTERVDLEDVATGLYFVQVQAGRAVRTIKIRVQ